MKENTKLIERIKKRLREDYGIDTLEQLKARAEADGGLDIGIFVSQRKETSRDGNAI